VHPGKTRNVSYLVRNLYYDGLDVLINHVEERTGTRVKVRQDADVAEGLPTSQAEWAWLVRFCGRFVPDQPTAEDLTQETLIVAWQGAHELRDPAARTAWLAGIARRRCLMWWRRRQREMAHFAEVPGRRGSPSPSVEDLPGDGDMEIDLERDELAHVLDHALALLPATTRQALVQHYVDGLPQAEIAARLGVSEGTLAVRLHRSRLALRRVLTTRLAHEAAPYGLGWEDSAGEQETRIWCPTCGQCRLQGHMGGMANELLLRCPACDTTPEFTFARVAQLDKICPGIKGYKPALNRVLRWTAAYWAGLVDGHVPCPLCGRPTLWRVGLDDNDPSPRPAAWAACTACHCRAHADIGGIALGQPAAQRFWRANPRIRTLPPRQVEVAGRAALMTQFESVTGSATLTVVSARDTFETLSVDGTPDA